jgi:hypothetical protein
MSQKGAQPVDYFWFSILSNEFLKYCSSSVAVSGARLPVYQRQRQPIIQNTYGKCDAFHSHSLLISDGVVWSRLFSCARLQEMIDRIGYLSWLAEIIEMICVGDPLEFHVWDRPEIQKANFV